MDTLQDELQSQYPLLHIELIGVNQKGQEAGNGAATEGTDLPWLQDVDADANGFADVAVDSWQVTLRDLVILDGANTRIGLYNLTDHNLAVAANYQTLREMLLEAAMQSQRPWRNPADPLDVDANGLIAPLDVLRIINVLNSTGPSELPIPTAADAPPPYLDPNGDGVVAPLDALVVINHLNAAVQGEGESVADRSAAAAFAADPPATAALPAPDSQHTTGVCDGTADPIEQFSADNAARTGGVERALAESDGLTAVDGRRPALDDWLEALDLWFAV